MSPEDRYIPDGFLIGRVIADLMARVTALEQSRRPMLSPKVEYEDFEKPVQAVGARVRHVTAKDQKIMGAMREAKSSVDSISEATGFSDQTVRNQLIKLGLMAPPKRRTK